MALVVTTARLLVREAPRGWAGSRALLEEPRYALLLLLVCSIAWTCTAAARLALPAARLGATRLL